MSNPITGDASGVSSKFDAFGQELFVGDWIACFSGGRGSFYLTWGLLVEMKEGSFTIKVGRIQVPPPYPNGQGRDYRAPRDKWFWVDDTKSLRKYDNVVKGFQDRIPDGLIKELEKKFYGLGDGETPPEAAS